MISPKICWRLSLLSAVFTLGVVSQASADAYSEALKARLTSQNEAFAALPKSQKKQITAFYKARDYRPLWIGDYGLNTKADRLFTAFKIAHNDALNPNDYRSVLLNDNWEIAADVLQAPEHLAKLETDIMASALLYGRHASAGRVVPGEVNYKVKLKPVAIPLKDILNALSTSVRPEKYLLSLLPKHPQYIRLKQKYAQIIKTQASENWPKIISYKIIRPGTKHANVALLRKRLIASGDYTPPLSSLVFRPATDIDHSSPENLSRRENVAEFFDTDLKKAVMAFQKRHHLHQDGAVGPKTLSVLNGPSLKKREQIALNMERFRWLPKDLGKRHVLVNQPEFKLRVFEGSDVIYHSRVIIGKRRHQTPVFSDKISLVVFNPSWNVPFSIATKEILPRLRQDPSYLARHNMALTTTRGRRINAYDVDWSQYSRKTFNFRIRQRPGRRNALGRIKFLFPNKHSIYLHDTPSKRLFKRTSRAFSHGCVRVQNPQLLAEVLLSRDKGWSLKRVNRSIRSGRGRTVRLSKKVPIHLAYFTTWVDENGKINFLKDIYRRDKKLNIALNQVEIAMK